MTVVDLDPMPAQQTMICKLCNKNRKLIKAHIIPRAIYELVKEGRDSHLVVVQNKDETFPKKSRIGFYDNSILCSDCDGRLGKYDDYGVRVLFGLEHQGTEVKAPDGRVVALKVLDFDYTRMKLFFLSTLWRASVSNHEHFSRVKLGSYEARLRQLIHGGDPGAPDEFPVFLTRFTGIDPRLTMMDPVYVRMDSGVRHWILYLVECNAYIKVDQRAASTSFQRLALTPNQPIYVALQDFASSKEAGVFDAVVKRIQKM